ncbi:hypothetical protein B5S31_g3813 [[Candida] boidinii]|nr:hypothetical protein B5S31_g3813 [[Candida] boidinii]
MSENNNNLIISSSPLQTTDRSTHSQLHLHSKRSKVTSNSNTKSKSKTKSKIKVNSDLHTHTNTHSHTQRLKLFAKQDINIQGHLKLPELPQQPERSFLPQKDINLIVTEVKNQDSLKMTNTSAISSQMGGFPLPSKPALNIDLNNNENNKQHADKKKNKTRSKHHHQHHYHHIDDNQKSNTNSEEIILADSDNQHNSQLPKTASLTGLTNIVAKNDILIEKHNIDNSNELIYTESNNFTASNFPNYSSPCILTNDGVRKIHLDNNNFCFNNNNELQFNGNRTNLSLDSGGNSGASHNYQSSQSSNSNSRLSSDSLDSVPSEQSNVTSQSSTNNVTENSNMEKNDNNNAIKKDDIENPISSFANNVLPEVENIAETVNKKQGNVSNTNINIQDQMTRHNRIEVLKMSSRVSLVESTFNDFNPNDSHMYKNPNRSSTTQFVQIGDEMIDLEDLESLFANDIVSVKEIDHIEYPMEREIKAGEVHLLEISPSKKSPVIERFQNHHDASMEDIKFYQSFHSNNMNPQMLKRINYSNESFEMDRVVSPILSKNLAHDRSQNYIHEVREVQSFRAASSPSIDNFEFQRQDQEFSKAQARAKAVVQQFQSQKEQEDKVRKIRPQHSSNSPPAAVTSNEERLPQQHLQQEENISSLPSLDNSDDDVNNLQKDELEARKTYQNQILEEEFEQLQNKQYYNQVTQYREQQEAENQRRQHNQNHLRLQKNQEKNQVQHHYQKKFQEREGQLNKKNVKNNENIQQQHIFNQPVLPHVTRGSRQSEKQVQETSTAPVKLQAPAPLSAQQTPVIRDLTIDVDIANKSSSRQIHTAGTEPATTTLSDFSSLQRTGTKISFGKFKKSLKMLGSVSGSINNGSSGSGSAVSSGSTSGISSNISSSNTVSSNGTITNNASTTITGLSPPVSGAFSAYKSPVVLSTPMSTAFDHKSLDKSLISTPIAQQATRAKLKSKFGNSSTLAVSSYLLNYYKDKDFSSLLSIELERLQNDLILKLCNDQLESISFESYINKINKDNMKTFDKISESKDTEIFVENCIVEDDIEKISIVREPKYVLKVLTFGKDELDQIDLNDVIQELAVTQSLSNDTKCQDSFVKLESSVVVHGPFPKLLANAWNKHDIIIGEKSINSRPTKFEDDQLHLILRLNYEGENLEKFKINSWREAYDIFWNIVKTLVISEENLEFEHRDLHWGNILLKRNNIKNNLNISSNGKYKFENSNFISLFDAQEFDEEEVDDISVKIIDCSNCRYKNSNNGGKQRQGQGQGQGQEQIIYTGLDNPKFFKGKNDYSFDIYKIMRQLVIEKDHLNKNNMIQSGPNTSTIKGKNGDIYYSTGSGSTDSHSGSSPSQAVGGLTTNLVSHNFTGNSVDWSQRCLSTNILWLHYILDKLIYSKGLESVKKPNSKKSSKNNISLEEEYTSYKKLISLYHCLDPRKISSSSSSSSSIITPSTPKSGHKRNNSNNKNIFKLSGKQDIEKNFDFKDFKSVDDLLEFGIRHKFIDSRE